MVHLDDDRPFEDDRITFLRCSPTAYDQYLDTLPSLEKLIFHPFTHTCVAFLGRARARFPGLVVYWAVWSAELYSLPPFTDRLYGSFSKQFVKKQMALPEKIRNLEFFGGPISRVAYALGLRKDFTGILKRSFREIDFFCALLPTDFMNYRLVSGNTVTRHLPFSYFSLQDVLPHPNDVRASGPLIMVGHSASPKGNHFEILETLAGIDPSFPLFVPLTYGDRVYGDVIEKEAKKRFPHAEVIRDKMEKEVYYRKLGEVGWSIINVRVQQALGNIIALLWMGAKVFLDEDSSTYQDFTRWGITVYSVQRDLTRKELTSRLSADQLAQNRKKILEKCDEPAVREYWEQVLC